MSSLECGCRMGQVLESSPQTSLRHGRQNLSNQQNQLLQPVFGIADGIAVCLWYRLVDANAVFATSDPQQSTVMQSVQDTRCRFRVSAPRVHLACPAEVLFEVTRMQAPLLRDEVQNALLRGAEPL